MRKRIFCVILTVLLLLGGCGKDSPETNPQTQPSSLVSTDTPTSQAPTAPENTEPTEHEHSWSSPTCTTPAQCECGETKGSPFGHDWEYPTCTRPAQCRCGETTGEPLGHSYQNSICSRCGDSNPTQSPAPTPTPNPTPTPTPEPTPDSHSHTDKNSDDKCDICGTSVAILIDFYAINDLHGKFCDSDSQPGVDELATYLKSRKNSDDNVVILSSGDMWQGAAESNLTNGLLLTEWMNAMGFVSMTLGNHEFDWGQDAIKENNRAADFPLLAINIYDKSTGKQVSYCKSSVTVERDGVKIGIIGAVGDCYSSISSDKVADVEFKTGSQLTSLVKAEATRLRQQGVDIIVYAIHDGYGSNTSGSISDSKLDDYYDPSLSDGYIDLSFEGHSHKSYVLTDSGGVYHLQGGGENKGISHVEISFNTVTENVTVTTAEIVKSSVYSQYEDDPQTNALEKKYSDIIDEAYNTIGTISSKLSGSEICDIVSGLYLEAGLEKWGSQYDIVLGGGYLNTRSPYNLYAGQVTYSDVLSLLPFDNQLVLCKISGKNLKKRFINNSDYYNTYSDYGNSVSISNSATYYVVVDMYTAVYSPNKLTIVEYYDEGVYARDLLAEAIRSGQFD